MNNLESKELETIGMNAYRSGEYEEAIAAFKALSSRSPSAWNARLYLGMAYTKLGRIPNAIQEFRDISEWCSDRDLRDKASAALRAMNQMSNSRMDAVSKQKPS